MRVEIHVLQNFAPANLNRDDTGSPKDCEFGGYRRARISSQCIKRQVRWHPPFRQIVEATFALRSTQHARQVAQLLADNQDNPRPLDEAYQVARYMFQRMGFKEKDERLTVMLLLGEDEIKTIARAASDNWDVLAPLSNASRLWEQLASQLASYLDEFGTDAHMLAQLIANHKAGSANASTLQKWLALPKERWSDAIAAARGMGPELLTELRDKYNVEAEEERQEDEDEEEYVSKDTAKLFKNKRNKPVIDALKGIDVKGATEAETSNKKEFAAKLKGIFNPLQRLTTKAVDVAMFGRMIAEIKTGAMNVDAACQVAHAISTHRVAMESDYFTAVEELRNLTQQQGVATSAGAGMIGSVEFNSACYYRYASLDVAQLSKNLQGDIGLACKATGAFLKAFIEAIPTGKQNSFASNSQPSLVFAIVRNGAPVSLVNAFVKPIEPQRERGLVEKSIEALDDYYGRLIGMYGEGGRKSSSVCQMDRVPLQHLKDEVGSVEKLIAAVTDAAFPAGRTT